MGKTKKATAAETRKIAEAQKAQKKQLRMTKMKDAMPQATGKKGPSFIKDSKNKKK